MNDNYDPKEDLQDAEVLIQELFETITKAKSRKADVWIFALIKTLRGLFNNVDDDLKHYIIKELEKDFLNNNNPKS